MQRPAPEPGAQRSGARRNAARSVWFACALAAVALLGRRQLTDFDLPWNLATGRIVLQTRHIPSVDDLAFTARPLRYVEVMGDSLLYAVYAVTGPAGLQLLAAVIGVSVLALLEARSRGLGSLRWSWAGLGLFALSDW